MDDLDALEVLLAEAALDDFPLPWRVEETEHDVTLYDAHEYVIEFDNFPRTARLVVKSRNALPTLLAELRRLRRVEAAAKAYEAAVIDLDEKMVDGGRALNDAYYREHETKAALWGALEP